MRRRLRGVFGSPKYETSLSVDFTPPEDDGIALLLGSEMFPLEKTYSFRE